MSSTEKCHLMALAAGLLCCLHWGTRRLLANALPSSALDNLLAAAERSFSSTLLENAHLVLSSSYSCSGLPLNIWKWHLKYSNTQQQKCKRLHAFAHNLCNQQQYTSTQTHTYVAIYTCDLLQWNVKLRENITIKKTPYYRYCLVQ